MRQQSRNAVRRAVKSRSLHNRSVRVPLDQDTDAFEADGKVIHLTNLRKIFWPDLGITKRDLLEYYIGIAPVLLPHLTDRAMVMKRYPNGIAGDFFFMKRAPSPRPEWIETCAIEHASGNIIDFPIIADLAALVWVINLGCIDLNPWYARCDDVDRPDYLHFDLDPVKDASWSQMLEAAALVHEALTGLGMPALIKIKGVVRAEFRPRQRRLAAHASILPPVRAASSIRRSWIRLCRRCAATFNVVTSSAFSSPAAVLARCA